MAKMMMTRTQDGKRGVLHTKQSTSAAKAITSLWPRLGQSPEGLVYDGYIAGKTWEIAEGLLNGFKPEQIASGAHLLDELLHREHLIESILILDDARAVVRREARA